VAAITAAKIFGGAFEHKHARAGAPRRECRTKRRITAANHENVTGWIRIRHIGSVTQISFHYEVIHDLTLAPGRLTPDPLTS
jgi:hypothetical protein